MKELQLQFNSRLRHLFLFYSVVFILVLSCYFTAVSFLSNSPFDRTDFGKFYNSSLLFFSGKNIYEGWVYTTNNTHDRNDQNNISQSKPKLRLTNLNTPVLALMMLPFGWLSYSTSLWSWTILSILAGFTSVLLVQRAFGNQQWSMSILLLTGFFAYYPTFINITAGQVELITLLFLVVGWRLGRARQDAWAGVFLGIAFSIKLFIGLFLILFLMRRQWRVVAWMLSTVFFTALIATLCMGIPVYWQYLHVFQQVKWYSGSWNASLYGFLIRLFGSPYEKNIPLIYCPGVVHTLYGVGVAFILWGMLWITRVRDTIKNQVVWLKQYDITFSYTIVAMLLISPLAWNYYFSSLIIPIIFAVSWTKSQTGSSLSLMHLMIAVILFLSGMPENSLKPHEITQNSIIAWSASYFVALVLLQLMILIIKKSTFMLQDDTVKGLAKIQLSHYVSWYAVALLPSFVGIYRMVIALSPL
jgi:hypothetical protein